MAKAAAPTTGTGEKRKLGGGRVSTKLLAAFTSQLSTLQEAGLPIVRSLRILENQMKAGSFKAIVGTVAEDVESGSPLSEALSRHPRAFDKLYVNLIRAGEVGGVLDTILQRLSGFLEKSEKLKKKVKGAMIYPMVVMTVALLILSAIMWGVIPQFEKMFADMGIELPGITQFLITISQGFVTYWYAIPLCPLSIFGAYKLATSSENGQYVRDKILLRVPVFGSIIRKTTISRFTRTFGTLIQSGVAILEALEITRNAVGNLVLARAIEGVKSSIREGESIAGPLSESGLFDDVIVNMVDVGEETGELDKMLMKVSDNLDYEVDVLVESMVSLMEPLLIVFMGGVVGTIVVALFMPMMKIIESI